MIPLAHTGGFGWDELVVFGTIAVALLVYRLVRGPLDSDEEAKSDAPGSPPGEDRT